MKLALVTPYTGANLGDAAIQEAVIASIRRRYPDADVGLVTLCPDVTAQVHGVRSFPLAARTVSSRRPMPEAGEPPGAPAGVAARPAAHWLKRAYRAVAPARLAGAVEEVRHVVRAFRWLRGADLVVVSGGGQLDDYWGGPWMHPYALLKWGVLARAVGARYVFLSVGSGAFESRLSRLMLRRALGLAWYRSYRDAASKRQLDALAFTRDDAVYPDLAFGYEHRVGSPAPGRPPARRVGVSPIAYLSRHGWPRTDAAVYERYVDALTGFVRGVVDDGCSVVLFATDGLDHDAVADLAARLTRAAVSNWSIAQPATHTLDALFAVLGSVDAVVASRLHGVVLAHRLCRPVLAVSYDRKVDTHMADSGMTPFCLPLRRVDAAALLDGFRALDGQADTVRADLAHRNARCARALEDQYDLVLGAGRR